MIKLLLSAFSEFPKSDVGGANKIIFHILKYIDYKKFFVTYHSSHIQEDFKNPISLEHQIKSSLNLKKKVGSNLFQKQIIFRNFFSSSFYINKYLKRCNRFFEAIQILPNIDILHSHDFRTLYYLKKFNIPKKILTIHSKGSFLNDLKYYTNTLSQKLLADYSQMENESINIADVITFPSYAAKDFFINEKKIQIDEDKIEIIYNGVDLEFIKTVKPEENFKERYSIPADVDVLLVNIADHIKVKHVDLVLKVVKYLKTVYKMKAFLINVGNGPLTKSLGRLSNKLNISDRVRFIGRLPYSEVIKLLKVSDCLVSAADKVVFDLIILEALASGIIVIANESGGNKEAISNGFNGYLVKEFSVEEFGDIIVKCDKIIKLNAIESAKKFDIKSMIENYQNLYLR